jgi:hypothetical protein
LRETLPRLSCFSVTEDELDLLIDVLGVPRPKGMTRGVTREEVRAIMERMKGGPVPEEAVVSIPPQPMPHLLDARWERGSCFSVSQFPGEAVSRLARVRDPLALGDQWSRAIQASEPNPAAIPLEPGEPDLRAKTREWQILARDLVHFARAETKADRNLYVSITFDC